MSDQDVAWWLSVEPLGSDAVWALTRVADGRAPDGPLDADLLPAIGVVEELVKGALPVKGAAPWQGPLLDRAAERELACAVGRVLLPPALRSALLDAPAGQRHTVSIAVRGWLAQVPWDALAIDDVGDRRLVECATVVAGLPATLHVGRARLPDHDADGPVLRVVDPGPRERERLCPEGTDRWYDLCADDEEIEPVGTSFSRDDLGERLRRHPTRLVYYGHAVPGVDEAPAAAGLLLSDRAGAPDVYTAFDWLAEPLRFPAPARVAVIACGSDDSTRFEQSGIPVAAINAGAELLTATRWILPVDQAMRENCPTMALGMAVDECHAAADPLAALRAWQIARLEGWRDRGEIADTPLLWASLVTYLAPGGTRVSEPDADRIRAALEHGAPADELAAWGEVVDDDLARELLERLFAIAAQDRRAASHYALRLAALAAGMPPARGTPVLTEVDLLRAAMAVDDGRFAEAVRRARAVLARVDERDDPDAVAGAEEILGGVAREQGRLDETITHWDRARRLYLVDEGWFGAARAAASCAPVAREAGRGDAELWRRWAEAAELFDRAGVDDDARICGVNASVYAVKVLKTPDPAGWDAARLRSAALDARAFALRFGAGHEAAHLAVLVSVAMSDLGSPPAEVLFWTARARTEYAALQQVGATDLDMWPVFADFAEGNAAILMGDPVRAEPALRRAMAGYERAGDRVRARACRMQLLTIAYTGERDGARARTAFRREDWSDADTAAVASLAEEHLAQQEGRDADAARLHARTRALLADAGEPVKVLANDVAYATWRLGRGDRAPAGRALAAADACLAAPPPGSSHALLRTLRFLSALLRVARADAEGDRWAAIAGLADAEEEMLRAGSRMLAARTAVSRGRLLLAAGDPTAALAAGLPAALALDAVRFTFADAGRRYRWGLAAADGFALAYRAAVAAGRHRVVAELIEVARATAAPEPLEGPATGIEALLAEASQDALSPGPAVPVDPARTAIGLPARLRTPWATVAVGDALEHARRYLDPVRADTVADWTLTTAGTAGSVG